MTLPLKELIKLTQIISRIQVGQFDANDVDNLFMKLRPYAERDSVFFEVANYVAHSDARDRGLAQRSITAFIDAIRFFTEYTGPDRKLNITKPFPGYVYRLFFSQILLADELELKSKHRMSRASLAKKIQNNFALDKKDDTCCAKGKLGVELLGALSYLISYINVRPAFHVRELHGDLKKVMKAQSVAFDEEAWGAQADRISLAVLCLVSSTEYILPGGEEAHCELSTENHFRLISGERRLPTGELTSEPAAFGPLTIMGNATLKSGPKAGLIVSFSLIATDLDPRDHCDHRLFFSGPAPEAWGKCEAEMINFARDMSLTADFKLTRTDSLI